MAYQSFLVHLIAGFNVLMTLIALNVRELGIENPWLLLIFIPFSVWMGTYGANQLKSIGAPAPGVVKTVNTTEETTTPPKV